MDNTTVDCASIQSFADFFQSDITNITVAVAACPKKCSLAWGTGNPDLSGVGVFVSYSFQFAVCLVLGPCLAIIYRFLDEHRQKHLAQINIAALLTTLFLAGPIAVASIIDLKRRTTLFEVSFIYHLNIMELLATLILFLNIGWFRNRSDELLNKRRDFMQLILGLALHIGLFVGVITWIKKRSLPAEEIQNFVTACERLGVIVPDLPMGGTWLDKSSKHLRGFLGFLQVLGITLLGCILCCACIKYERIVHPLISTGLATGMAISFTKMYLARAQLARLGEPTYQDNEWGFGQIMALFVWMPLLVEMVIPALFVTMEVLIPLLLVAWMRAEGTIKRVVRKLQTTKSEQQGQHELEQTPGEEPINRAIEDVQITAGVVRRNTPRARSIV